MFYDTLYGELIIIQARIRFDQGVGVVFFINSIDLIECKKRLDAK
jgi:hypothetical protein